MGKGIDISAKMTNGQKTYENIFNISHQTHNELSPHYQNQNKNNKNPKMPVNKCQQGYGETEMLVHYWWNCKCGP